MSLSKRLLLSLTILSLTCTSWSMDGHTQTNYPSSTFNNLTVQGNLVGNTTAIGGLNNQSFASWFSQPSINVLGQGVKGDGSTNDQPALLTAAGLAQSSGILLFLPTPLSSFKLSNDWEPASGDFSVFMSPGVTFSGPGLVRFDNQLPSYVYPFFTSILNARTYSGSFYSQYNNINMNANIATNSGVGNVVAVFGVGRSMTSASPSWGGQL